MPAPSLLKPRPSMAAFRIVGITSKSKNWIPAFAGMTSKEQIRRVG